MLFSAGVSVRVMERKFSSVDWFNCAAVSLWCISSEWGSPSEMAAVVGTSRGWAVIFGGCDAGVSAGGGSLVAVVAGLGTSAPRRFGGRVGRGLGLLAIVVGGSAGAVAAGSSSPGGKTSGGGMMALSGSVGAGTSGCGFA